MSSDPRSQKEYFFERTKLSRFTLFLFAIYFGLVMRLKVIGLENMPAEGGCLLVSNHLAQIDSFLLLHVSPRHVLFMAKEEIFEHPASDYFCRHMGSFPVHRDRLDRWALKYALNEVLGAGHVLGIYPEGERSEQKQLQEAKVGPAYLAIKSERPLIPIAITGTHYVLKKWWPLRAPVTVRFGEPIYALPDETPQALTERMMGTIASMLPPDMRGVYQEKAVEVANFRGI
jgi:1-acyl-sn-glycerol-3-phosphate acyltransferase